MSESFNATYHDESDNKAIKYLKKAVSKLKSLKLPSSTSTTTSSSKPGCYAICIDNLGPIQIPTFYLPQTTNNGKIEILVYCSIFDSKELSFIGRTWTSTPFPTNRTNQALPIQKYWIYLKSIPSEQKWIIIELVAQTRNEGVVTSQISLGWNVIKLFANTRALIDVHPDENNNDPLHRESKLKSTFLFQGSPTYLLINNDITSIPETGIKISYKLFTFKKLIHISHLLASETIIGPNNVIPGLGHTLKIPQNPFDKSWQVVFDIKPIEFILSSPYLTLPEQFESEMLQKLTKIRKNTFCGSDETISRVLDRELNVSFYNGRNIITPPTVIQLQPHPTHNVLSWNGDIKIRVNANLQHNCWLLVSLNYGIEWKDDASSPQAPSYHHSVCVGRELVNMTSDELILNGTQPTKLILSCNFSWIDDHPIFNHIKPTNSNKPSTTNQDINASFIIRLSMTESATGSSQMSTKSTTKTMPPPQLSTMHHVVSFDLKDQQNNPVISIQSPAVSNIEQQQPQPTPIISNNPLSIKSIASMKSMAKSMIETPHTMNNFSVHVNNDNNNNNILPSPQGFMKTPQGMVAMNWDDIKKQSLMMIPSNVLHNKADNSSKLGMLQESFAMNTWQKLQTPQYSNAKVLKQTQSVRSLRAGYGGFDKSPYDVLPNRKHVDIEQELSTSHKRVFSINCTAFNMKAKQLLLNPIQSIVIQLDFMGERTISDPIMISSNSTINNLRESLMAEDKYESLPFIEPYQFEFQISPHQIRQFVHFLNSKYAIFTVFNANSMFQIGSCRICLRDFLLQNSSIDHQIQETIEINIISTKNSSEPSSIIETQPNISINSGNSINGKLSIAITHQAIDLSDAAKIQYAGWSEKLITNTCDDDGTLCVRDLKLMQSDKNRINAELLYKNPHILPKLQKLPNYHSESDMYQRISIPTQTIKTKWKIPMEAINELSSNKTESSSTDNEEWRVRTSNIETMKDFRDRRKQELLNKFSEPDQYIIQPSMGQTIFFEIKFTNPWNQRKKFHINIDDPVCEQNEDIKELVVVTNIREISYLKEKYNVSTTMQRHLFEKENINEMMVNALETVYIPFKFQSFASGSKQAKNASYPNIRPLSDQKLDNDDVKEIDLRLINVSVLNVEDDAVLDEEQDKENRAPSVVEFNVSVEPVQFCIDRRFDIYAFKSSKFVGNLPLPPIQNTHATQEEQILSVRCSSNQVAFEFDKSNENVTFRCDVCEYSERNEFYFIVFNDRYCIDINEIWEINLHSYFNENCHGMLGGIIKNNIHLPSIIDDLHMEHIQFYCDQQNGMELKLIENDNQKLLNIQYAPTDVGKKLMRIHCVDNTQNDILYSCLLIMHVEMPKINNSFVIYLESGDDEEIITRKLPYNNGYNQNRTYELVSNDPSIIRINNPMLEIPSESSMEFILEVMPKNIIGHSKEVLLFVTECGNLEQCLRIEVKKGKVTNL